MGWTWSLVLLLLLSITAMTCLCDGPLLIDAGGVLVVQSLRAVCNARRRLRPGASKPTNGGKREPRLS
jgi:hypothetical protein